MRRLAALVMSALWLVPAGPAAENPWKSRVAGARDRARAEGTAAAHRDALDAAWRADDRNAGEELAEAALQRWPDDRGILALAARALRRAGRLPESERVLAPLVDEPDDRELLALLAVTELSRGRAEPARAAAERLERLDPRNAYQWSAVLASRLHDNRLEGIAALVERAAAAVDPANGYPDVHLAESFEGLGRFFDAIGPDPINVVARAGRCRLSALALLNLPSCEAHINGRGPFRVVVDTGGSVALSLDRSVADELGLRILGQAPIRGVGGADQSGQALVDTLRLGEVECRRVMTRVYDVRQATVNSADAILGTGVLAQARVSFDFAAGALLVEPSSADAPAGGIEIELRVIGDAKPMALVTVHGRSAVALLDTGADAVVLSPGLLGRLHPERAFETAPVQGVGVGQGQGARLSIAPGVDLLLAQRKFENYSGLGLDALDDLISPILGVQTDVLIGMPIFREMRRFTIDFPRARAWIDWVNPPQGG